MKTLREVDIRISRTTGKRNLALENGDCQPLVEDKVEGQTSKTRHIFLDRMDAIAYGVEARYESITGRSRRVTEETVAIARELGMPEDEIERWASSRLTRNTEKVRVIKSILKRLQESSLAVSEMRNIQGKRLGSQSIARRGCKT